MADQQTSRELNVPQSEADRRLALYRECWKTYYEAYYSQLLADLVSGRWRAVDQWSKVLVALFSAGSAVAGWSVWNNEAGKLLWAICAGVATLLSIIQSSLGVSERLKAMLESRSRMLRIRLQFETMFSDMRLDENFDVSKSKERFDSLRRDYMEAVAQMPKESIYTARDERNVQETLDNLLR